MTQHEEEVQKRAKLIAEYLQIDDVSAMGRLVSGFHHNHALVAEDFRNANTNVNDEESLLNWYRNTDAYIWELSAYHLEEGFNYSGMCEGIRDHLLALDKQKILVLGDGVGTLSCWLAHAGLDVTYHDLEGSRTAGFAQHVFKDSELKVATKFTNDWKPTFPRNRFDAVIALDFFEHLVNVDVWAKAVHSTLKKTGVFMAQNAFACGDAEHGDSIPMHLSANNKYTEEWAPLMTKIGFTKMDSGWYQK